MKNDLKILTTFIIAFIMLFSLTSCASNSNTITVPDDNPSVNALKELAKDGLTINMHEYGGFEQTGLIGKTIASADSKMDVVPGDIVLYNSNQISIFYNNSNWSYTKLGHINLSKIELQDILDTDAVVTFTLK